MAIKRSITIDGMEVPFKASASLPRLYRAKFRKDIFKDFSALKDSVDESDEKNSGLGIESLEVFENIAWTTDQTHEAIPLFKLAAKQPFCNF